MARGIQRLSRWRRASLAAVLATIALASFPVGVRGGGRGHGHGGGPPPPIVGAVMPSRGPVEGGTAVTVTGSNFLPGARVTFGNAEATQVVVVAQDRITAVTPPHRPGRVNVTVETPSYQSGGRGWAFTYEKTGGE